MINPVFRLYYRSLHKAVRIVQRKIQSGWGFPTNKSSKEKSQAGNATGAITDHYTFAEIDPEIKLLG